MLGHSRAGSGDSHAGSGNSLAESASPEKHATPSFPSAGYRWRVWWVLAFYLPLLILPWVLTCIMSYRPLSAPSYINHAGLLTPGDFDKHERWQAAVNVMNVVAAVLTVPVTSLLLAEAASAWLQRREGQTSPVPLAHFYDLADRGWTDVATVTRELLHRAKARRRNWFLLGAAGLVIFCSAILPLQQLLTRSDNLVVVTCADVPYTALPNKSCPYPLPKAVAKDAQPATMERLPLWDVKEQVKARLESETTSQHQPLLWSSMTPETDQVYDAEFDTILSRYNYYATRGGALAYPYKSRPVLPFWISGVPNGTTTGVLRHHAMRFNSTISCESLPLDAFPDSCPGDHPFTASYPWSQKSLQYRAPPKSEDYNFRVCVPGSYVSSPWSLYRDATTIEEEIFMGLLQRPATLDATSLYYKPFVTRCTVQTTRGYFELGNVFNDNVPQPLLEKFPGDERYGQYNDYDTTKPLYRAQVYPYYTGP